MADDMALPCVITNENTALWTNALRAYEGKSSELISPGPRSRESVQWPVDLHDPLIAPISCVGFLLHRSNVQKLGHSQGPFLTNAKNRDVRKFKL